MKRFRTKLLAALVAGLALSGAALAQVRITYWHGFTGPDLPVMEQLIAEFNRTHPDIVVTAEAIPWGNLFQQIEPAVAAGQAPDVAALNEDVITGFILRGAVQEMTPDMLAAAGVEAERFFEPLWETGVVDGMDSPFSSVYPEKFYQAAPYVTMTNHSIAPFNILISEVVFQKVARENAVRVLKLDTS